MVSRRHDVDVSGLELRGTLEQHDRQPGASLEQRGERADAVRLEVLGEHDRRRERRFQRADQRAQGLDASRRRADDDDASGRDGRAGLFHRLAVPGHERRPGRARDERSARAPPRADESMIGVFFRNLRKSVGKAYGRRAERVWWVRAYGCGFGTCMPTRAYFVTQNRDSGVLTEYR